MNIKINKQVDLRIKLVFLKECQTRDEAFFLERKIKGWSRKKKEALINDNWQAIKKLAKKIFVATSFDTPLYERHSG